MSADDGTSIDVKTGRSGPRRTWRVRRSPNLVAYWRGATLVLANYATRTTAAATPLICKLLDACTDWKTPDQIAGGLQLPSAGGLPALIQRLTDLSFLERSDRPTDPQEKAMSVLRTWNPEAGFFHSASRDVPFSSLRKAREFTRRKLADSGLPAPVKRYRGVPLVDLPRVSSHGEFAAVLRSRRTWRRYSRAGITIQELATLLGYTAGVQHWAHSGGVRSPLKTSPSGGARHPIECYAVCRNVEGVAPGVYHYAADRHALERIRGSITTERMQAYVPNSEYFAKAAVMVFLTAVFERSLWRYPYSRAYRAALAEAGHVCQTFCLTATWLGLAPYCLMGLADTLIETDLGIDGIKEAVLYCAGAGRRPRGATLGSLERGTLDIRPNPRLR